MCHKFHIHVWSHFSYICKGQLKKINFLQKFFSLLCFSGSTDPSTTKLMSDAEMKVDKPAALGKAPETEATLDVTRDVGDTLRYT
jgi:hypothetical protein